MVYNKAKQPLVSIVIPAYNSVKSLKHAVESILEDSYPEIEIIIVDDGSNDGTAEIISQLKLNQPSKILSVRQDNAGGNAARNKGLDLATGEYIQFFDADDYFINNKIADSVSAFISDKSLCCVYTDGIQDTEEGIVIAAAHSNLTAIINKQFNEFTFGLNTNMPMFKHEFLIESGERWDEELKCWQEAEYFFRLVMALHSNDQILHLNQVGFVRTHNNEGVSAKQNSVDYIKHKIAAITQIHQACIKQGVINEKLDQQVDRFMWLMYKHSVLSKLDQILPVIVDNHINIKLYQRFIYLIPAHVLRLVNQFTRGIKTVLPHST